MYSGTAFDSKPKLKMEFYHTFLLALLKKFESESKSPNLELMRTLRIPVLHIGWPILSGASSRSYTLMKGGS